MSLKSRDAAGSEAIEFALADIDAELIAAWERLCERAADPNAFLSPHFVLPALRHLDPAARPVFVAVYATRAAKRELVGFGVFVAVPPSLQFPLRRLRAYLSKHSYISGLLIDRDCVAETLESFLAFFRSQRSRWDCIEFEHSVRDSGLNHALERNPRARGLKVSGTYQRPVLLPARAAPDASSAGPAKKRIKGLQRERRRLSEQGTLSWRFLTGPEADLAAALDRFALLENMGWKAEQGSSLLADSAGQGFLKSLSDEWAVAGNLFFFELIFNGDVISSACGMISGSQGFVFKIGWNPAFARFSPGLLNFLYLVEEAPTQCPQLKQIDSGSVEGGFIDTVWHSRQTMATILLPLNSFARVTLHALNKFRKLRSLLRGPEAGAAH